jgi:EAL domain-containing protein (putative c-di-GMP-specific phosphodiesterase class I)
VLPGEFIPVAEATGLIRPLGAWVLGEACRQGAAWQAAGLAVVVSVNLSPAELRGKGGPPRIGQALSQAGLAPAALELELTEGVLMETLGEGSDSFLRRLAARGVQLAIDDFGVGYSSLAYLRRLPVRKIKIDRSFTGAIGTDAGGETLLRSFVALGHSLGKRVVAEGVGSEAQLAFVRAAGCDEAQGYHLSRPVPASEAERLLRGGGPPPGRPPADGQQRDPPADRTRERHLAEVLRSLDDHLAMATEARLRAARCREQNRLARAQAEKTLTAAKQLVRRVRDAEPGDA